MRFLNFIVSNTAQQSKNVNISACAAPSDSALFTLVLPYAETCTPNAPLNTADRSLCTNPGRHSHDKSRLASYGVTLVINHEHFLVQKGYQKSALQTSASVSHKQFLKKRFILGLYRHFRRGNYIFFNAVNMGYLSPILPTKITIPRDRKQYREQKSPKFFYFRKRTL